MRLLLLLLIAQLVRLLLRSTMLNLVVDVMLLCFQMFAMLFDIVDFRVKLLYLLLSFELVQFISS